MNRLYKAMQTYNLINKIGLYPLICVLNQDNLLSSDLLLLNQYLLKYNIHYSKLTASFIKKVTKINRYYLKNLNIFFKLPNFYNLYRLSIFIKNNKLRLPFIIFYKKKSYNVYDVLPIIIQHEGYLFQIQKKFLIKLIINIQRYLLQFFFFKKKNLSFYFLYYKNLYKFIILLK